MACFEYIPWQWLCTYRGNAIGQVVGEYISAKCSYRGNAVGQVVGVYISAICTYRGNAVGQVVGVYISAICTYRGNAVGQVVGVHQCIATWHVLSTYRGSGYVHTVVMQ